MNCWRCADRHLAHELCRTVLLAEAPVEPNAVVAPTRHFLREGALDVDHRLIRVLLVGPDQDGRVDRRDGDRAGWGGDRDARRESADRVAETPNDCSELAGARPQDRHAERDDREHEHGARRHRQATSARNRPMSGEVGGGPIRGRRRVVAGRPVDGDRGRTWVGPTVRRVVMRASFSHVTARVRPLYSGAVAGRHVPAVSRLECRNATRKRRPPVGRLVRDPESRRNPLGARHRPRALPMRAAPPARRIRPGSRRRARRDPMQDPAFRPAHRPHRRLGLPPRHRATSSVAPSSRWIDQASPQVGRTRHRAVRRRHFPPGGTLRRPCRSERGNVPGRRSVPPSDPRPPTAGCRRHSAPSGCPTCGATSARTST